MLYLIFTYSLLADPVYAVRESASCALVRLMDRHPGVYGPRLAALAREATDPEVVARVRRPLNCFYRWRANSFVPSKAPVWPIADATFIPMLCGNQRCKGLGMAWYDGWCRCESGLEQGPWWWRYRAATERMVRSMLRNGSEPDEVDKLVSAMWEMECAVKGDCGDKWVESERWTRWDGGYPKPKE